MPRSFVPDCHLCDCGCSQAMLLAHHALDLTRLFVCLAMSRELGWDPWEPVGPAVGRLGARARAL